MLQVSSIGLGCVTFGREIDQDTAFMVMDRALARGITLFDTAEAYGRGASETVIGHWLAARGTRDRIVLATKVAGNLTEAHVLESAEASLRRLQVAQVDLFQLHRFDPDVPLEETLGALNEVAARGWARDVGCSNYSATQLAAALEIQARRGWARMVSVQPNYNLVERGIEQELLPLCAAQQIGVISYSPLGAGFLTGKYRESGPVPAGTRFDMLPNHQNIYFKARGWQVMEGLRARSEALGISMPHLALAWAIGQPGITSVLIGARNTAQVDQAFAAEAMGLTPKLRAELNAL
jgi:aryl-alcohol dehydrogenase-like predicted oxidoreductase